jgi:hypothetical protein
VGKLYKRNGSFGDYQTFLDFCERFENVIKQIVDYFQSLIFDKRSPTFDLYPAKKHYLIPTHSKKLKNKFKNYFQVNILITLPRFYSTKKKLKKSSFFHICFIVHIHVKVKVVFETKSCTGLFKKLFRHFLYELFVGVRNY